jgi:hypothetical protein
VLAAPLYKLEYIVERRGRDGGFISYLFHVKHKAYNYQSFVEGRRILHFSRFLAVPKFIRNFFNGVKSDRTVIV